MDTCRGMLATFALILCLASPSAAATTELVSVSSAGTQGNGHSMFAAMSADGRFVAFTSEASNLVSDDTNGGEDVFVRDRVTGDTVRVSVASDGSQANGPSYGSAISADGRFVVFGSSASNLVSGDTNGRTDIFWHDRLTGETTRVSVSSDGSEANAWSRGGTISGDGRFTAFTSLASNLVPNDTHPARDVFVHDAHSGETARISVDSNGMEGNGHSEWPSLSADGRYVVFSSYASNLVEGDTNGRGDVFVHDRVTGETARVSVSSQGFEGDDGSSRCSISSDGRFVVFLSFASTLVPDDTNGGSDVFVHDRQSGETRRVSVTSDGSQFPYASYSFGLGPVIAAGRYVVFESDAINLLSEEYWRLGSQVFLHDLGTGHTSIVSLTDDDALPDSACWAPAVSADGRLVVFASPYDSVVAADENGWGDIFLRDRLTFEDIPLDHWAFYEVGACHMADIVAGYPDGLYHPEFRVSRDQMAVYIARAVAGPTVPAGPVEATFPDVATDFWAYDHVECAVANDVVEGYADGKYHPDWTLTRGQMAVFIARSVVTPTGEAGLATYDPPGVPTFPDVPTYYWCYKHVEYCAEHDIVSGYSDGSYQPIWGVTRDQMAVFIQRAFRLPE